METVMIFAGVIVSPLILGAMVLFGLPEEWLRGFGLLARTHGRLI